MNYMLCEEGADKEARGEYGSTPLHMAVETGHLNVAQCPREQGDDKEVSDEDGLTPLSVSAACGHRAVVLYIQTM